MDTSYIIPILCRFETFFFSFPLYLSITLNNEYKQIHLLPSWYIKSYILLDVMLFPFQGPLYIQSFVKNDAKNCNREQNSYIRHNKHIPSGIQEG